jgi:hypothetical protein
VSKLRENVGRLQRRLDRLEGLLLRVETKVGCAVGDHPLSASIWQSGVGPNHDGTISTCGACGAVKTEYWPEASK